MVDGDSYTQKEKQRLCPSCRMEIPVLAVKCRFCGEEVGRPKDETRQLTVNDLGGESRNHYAPSGNVMDALEAFRAEMMADYEDEAEDPNAKRRSNKRNKKSDAEPKGFKSTPPVANVDDDLIVPIGRTSPRPHHRETPHANHPTWMKKIGYLGSFVAIVLILVFGGVRVTAVVKEMMSRNNNTSASVFRNRAPEIMEAGGPSIEALSAAAEALSKDPSTDNKDIIEKAAQLVATDVENLLNAPEWTPADLKKASELAHRASSLYPSNVTRKIRENAQTETFMYQMTLVSSDPDAKTAVLSITRPDGTRDRVKVSEGDTVNGRFIARNIWRDRVTIEDTKRLAKHDRNRTVSVEMMGVTVTS